MWFVMSQHILDCHYNLIFTVSNGPPPNIGCFSSSWKLYRYHKTSKNKVLLLDLKYPGKCSESLSSMWYKPVLSWWRGRQQLYFCLQSTEQKTKKLQFNAINNNKIPGLCGGGAIFQPSIMTSWTWADCVFEMPWVITPDPSVAQSVIKLVSWQQGVLCVQAFFRLQFSVCLESSSRLTKNSDSHWSSPHSRLRPLHSLKLKKTSAVTNISTVPRQSPWELGMVLNVGHKHRI